MKKVQFEPLVIHDYEEEVFHLPNHSHTYYELVFIWKGIGFHHINGHKMSYSKNNLFIVSPQDEHYFEIKKSTHFTFIKFTKEYLNNYFGLQNVQMFLNLLHYKRLKEEKVRFQKEELCLIKSWVTNLTLIDRSEQNHSYLDLAWMQLISILSLVQKNCNITSLPAGSIFDGAENISSYIHQNINDPQMLKVNVIAKVFNISPNYFSDYFKKKYAISYRTYLSDYKMSLIKSRLSVEALPIKNIAAEFGFIDESHLSKFFKMHASMSPRRWKRYNYNKK